VTEAITYRIGLDVAKGVFQVHGVKNEAGEPVVIRRRLKRGQVEGFFAKLPRSVIGMEACSSAQHWARLAQSYGHEVRLMPPAYVKAYVKRNKTDAHDAAAICEAVGRPSMRFVAVKSESDQAMLMLHRVRASFVVKRTAAANQLRAAFAEFGLVAPVGARGFKELLASIESEEASFARLPRALRLVLTELAWQWKSCEAAVRRMDVEIAAAAKASERARRLTRVPGIGPVGASAIDVLLPDPQLFRSGRDFAAWVGLTPREESSGKTVKRGSITKKGDGYLRRLLVLGATAHLARVRRGHTKGASAWVVKIAAHPKRKLAAVALANKMARIAWAMLATGEDYRAPAALPQAA